MKKSVLLPMVALEAPLLAVAPLIDLLTRSGVKVANSESAGMPTTVPPMLSKVLMYLNG